ncbi:MAG: protein-glutamate O-methyltransferase CheR [Campylobacterales bacterium]
MNDLKITQKEFELFRDYIYREVGISLAAHKITLVQGRLSKRLRHLGLGSYKEYYDYMVADKTGEEAFHLISAISTNVTTFFREAGQWDFLEDSLPALLAKKKDKKLRIWSAACSSGEEPYSIAIFLQNHIPDFTQWDIKILATDISKKVLQKAIDGVYEEKDIQSLPKHLLSNSFDALEGTPRRYRVKAPLRDRVMFRMFNLVYDNFGLFKNPFDIIFCRNVMIYFDAPTQQQLISHFHRVLAKEGWLFVGHSESLTRNKEEFKLLRPSIYQKI